MFVEGAIQTLSDLRDEKGHELSVEECHAIGIALVIMIALEPSQVTMINALIVMTATPQN
ncbi:hypothetical protein ES703_104861 [subsurface metagenome]